MKYTEHQKAVLAVVEDLVKKGTVVIEIPKHVFGFPLI